MSDESHESDQRDDSETGEENSDQGGSGEGSSGDGDRKNPKKNPIEWAAVIAGALLLIVLVGYLVFRTATQQESRPSMTVWVEEGRRQGDDVEFIIHVRNDGKAAERVRVEVCDRLEQCRDFEFRYVPSGATRNATVVLSSPTGEVEASLMAFAGT